VAQARLAWWTEADDGVGGIGPERLVFLDECGVLTTMVRLRGRSPRGTRARASAPFGHWTRVTVLGALGTEGIVGAMSVEAATDAAVFHAYLEQVLLPPASFHPLPRVEPSTPPPELRRTKPEGASRNWGDHAAIANCGPGLETGSKRWPNPEPSAPL
jgi:hypothetical protein